MRDIKNLERQFLEADDFKRKASRYQLDAKEEGFKTEVMQVSRSALHVSQNNRSLEELRKTLSKLTHL